MSTGLQPLHLVHIYDGKYNKFVRAAEFIDEAFTMFENIFHGRVQFHHPPTNFKARVFIPANIQVELSRSGVAPKYYVLYMWMLSQKKNIEILYFFEEGCFARMTYELPINLYDIASFIRKLAEVVDDRMTFSERDDNWGEQYLENLESYVGRMKQKFTENPPISYDEKTPIPDGQISERYKHRRQRHDQMLRESLSENRRQRDDQSLRDWLLENDSERVTQQVSPWTTLSRLTMLVESLAADSSTNSVSPLH